MDVWEVACCKMGALSFNTIINAMMKMSQDVFSLEGNLLLEQVVEKLVQTVPENFQ